MKLSEVTKAGYYRSTNDPNALYEVYSIDYYKDKLLYSIWYHNGQTINDKKVYEITTTSGFTEAVTAIVVEKQEHTYHKDTYGGEFLYEEETPNAKERISATIKQLHEDMKLYVDDYTMTSGEVRILLKGYLNMLGDKTWTTNK